MRVGVRRGAMMLALAAFMVTTMVAGSANGSPGGLDPTFASGGIYLTTPAAGTYRTVDLDVQSDGKVVLGGNFKSTADGATNDTMLARLKADGTLDSSFGTNGVAVQDFAPGQNELIQAPVVEPDGKILGIGRVNVTGTDNRLAVSRWTAAGQVDDTFGDHGVAIVHVGDRDAPSSAVVEPDGKIVVSGSDIALTHAPWVVRMTSTGALDSTFGDGGIVFDPQANGGGELLVQPDGKIVVGVTYLNGGVGVVRYTADGARDTSFGPACGCGRTSVPLPGSGVGWGVVRQPDGKLVVSGGFIPTGSSDESMLVARFTSTGAVDKTFGSGGKVTTQFGPFVDESEEVLLQPNGRIVSAGFKALDANLAGKDVALARYMPNGALDTSFGVGGKLTTDVANSVVSANGGALTPDGRIVVGGPAAANGVGVLFAARYLGDRAVITEFSPGTAIAGAPFSIEGQNFIGVTSVKVGGVSWPFHVASQNQITATVPASAVSGTVSVANGGGTATTDDSFTMLPSLTGFSPVSGAAGTAVTISGSGLGGATGVVFTGGAAAPVLAGSSATQVKTTVPGGAEVGPITVVTPSGPVTTVGSFKPLPKITLLSPSAARVGDDVAINGTNLHGATSVKLGTLVLATTEVSATKLTFTVPPVALTGKVAITTPGGSFTTSGNFGVLPTISDFSPTMGAAGTVITINGETFTGTTSVKVGGVAWPFHLVNAQRLTATAPSTTVDGALVVANAGGSTTADTFIVQPRIASFTPTSGAAQTIVSITGTGLADASIVRLGGEVADIVSKTATLLKVKVPATAPVGPIKVTTSFAVSDETAASFKPLPRITSFTPSGVRGAIIEVDGTNLTGATVKIGTAPVDSLVVDSPTHLHFAIPDTALTGKLVVTTPGGTFTTAGNLGVVAKVLGMAPDHGVAGAHITITGNVFVGVTSVKVGGVSWPFRVLDSTHIDATVPAAAVSGSAVVTNAGGPGTPGNVFSVEPRVTGFSPSSATAGTIVTISGTGLAGTSDVTFFNGAPADQILSTSPNSVRATVPAYAEVGPVEVTQAGVTSQSPTVFKPLPRLGLLPSFVLAGDKNVGIPGSNLLGTSSVKLGSLALPVKAVTAIQVTVDIPSDAVTGKITLTTPGGSTTSSGDLGVRPTIQSFTPETANAGDKVTITGKTFLGATSVKVGGVSWPFHVDSATQITATIPSSAGNGPLIVGNAGGFSAPAAHFFIVKPHVTGFSPASAAAGSNVTITGTGLVLPTVPDAAAVTFAGEPAQVVSSTATAIVARVPATATVGKIVVTNAGGTSPPSPLDFKPLPKLGTLPTVQAGDSGVLIPGTNLTGATNVKLGSLVLDVTPGDATGFTVHIPDNAVTGKVSLTTPGGSTTSSGNLGVRPTVPALVTDHAQPGAPLVIAGVTFTGTTSVKFHGTAAAFSVLSPTSIRATVPAGVTRGPITITNAGGSTPSPDDFLPDPKPTGFSPASGVEGTVVTINGSGLDSVDHVVFGGASAVPSQKSATSLTVAVPAGATSGQLDLFGESGADALTAGTFNVTLAITGLSKQGGVRGTPITITGAGFTSSSVVKFGDTLATVTSQTPTSLATKVPDVATTGKITVTNGDVHATSLHDFVVPRYTDISPNGGPEGSTVTITGDSFGSTPSVLFTGSGNFVAATDVAMPDANTITAKVPVGAVTGGLWVVTEYGTLVTATFVVPRVTGLSSDHGSPGDTITITGQAFDTATSVSFNGATATPTVENNLRLTVTVPDGATTGPVSVTTAYGVATAPTSFTVDPVSIDRPEFLH